MCFDLLNGNWIQRGDVIYSTGGTYYFDIDINEDASIVFCVQTYVWNSPVTGNESGRVKVFAWQNNVWDQLGNTLSGGQNAWFGRSLSCNSDGSMFACWRNDPRRVDIYSFANYQWELLQSIPSDDTGNLYYLNLDISSSGQLLAIRQRNFINGVRIDVHSLKKIITSGHPWILALKIIMLALVLKSMIWELLPFLDQEILIQPTPMV